MWHLFFPASVLISLVAGFIGAGPLSHRLYDAAGGKDQFVFELEKLSLHASALRNGISNNLYPVWEGSSGYVTRLKFEDGVSWAAKISENLEKEAEQGVMALKAIEQYCPGIPAPRVHGELYGFGNSRFRYYFTDWIDGHSLQDTQEYIMNYRGPGEYEITIPDRVIPQVAQFIHNLTSCPIPPHIRVQLIDGAQEGIDNLTVVELPEVHTWLSIQYFEKLLKKNQPDPSFNGIDTLVLLGWFKDHLPEDDEFVLNYFDLRAPNILFDDSLNIAGIIDWEGVRAIPLSLTATGLSRRLFPEFHTEILGDTLVLNPEQETQFLKELSRLGSEKLARYSNDSRAYMFMDRMFLGPEFDWPLCKEYYPDLLEEALRRTPRRLKNAAFEWNIFKAACYEDSGNMVPKRPVYVEIQEGLEEYGATPFRHPEHLNQEF